MLSAYETGQQSPSLISVDKILQALGYDIRHLARALQRAEGGSEWTEELEAAPFTGFEAPAESPLRVQIHGLLDEEEKRVGSLTHRERMILDHILFGIALSGRYVRGGTPGPAAPEAGGGPEKPADKDRRK